MSGDADWEQVQQEYEAGEKSLRQIGRDHGITHTAVRKRAKAENWQEREAAANNDGEASTGTEVQVELKQAQAEFARIRGVLLETRGRLTEAEAQVQRLVSELPAVRAGVFLGEIPAEDLERMRHDLATSRRDVEELPAVIGLLENRLEEAHKRTTAIQVAVDEEHGRQRYFELRNQFIQRGTELSRGEEGDLYRHGNPLGFRDEIDSLVVDLRTHDRRCRMSGEQVPFR